MCDAPFRMHFDINIVLSSHVQALLMKASSNLLSPLPLLRRQHLHPILLLPN